MEIKIIPRNLDLLKQAYLHTTVNSLTINDIYIKGHSCWCKCTCTCGKEAEFRLSYVIKNRNKSCGCAVSPEVASAKNKAFWKNNPDKVAARANKYHEWCVSNPDKVKKKAKKVSEFYKAHPEVAASNGKKCSQWYKNNPDKVKKRSEKYTQWCKDNPQEVAEKISTPVKNSHKKKRIASITDEILSVVHPDDIEKLLNGEFHSCSTDWIRVKCPQCGNYDYHPVSNVIKYRTKSLDLKLCKDCAGVITTSKSESEIAEYISTIYNGECIRNSRDIISPLELDLYYPEKKIAIEFNGIYWHSEMHKPYNYHFNKFKLCKEAGIRLISIFEQDWKFKCDDVKNILDEAFLDLKSIYARKCKIRSLSRKEKSSFINEYHFYGDSCQGTISYGLFYEDSLVSVMTFGKLRGQNSLRNNEGCYELVRYVTKRGLVIVGGASKLIKHFISDYSPNYILCYSDNDFFTGNIYGSLGFTLKSLGEKSIDYQWCNNSDVLSRQQCMPYKLLNKFPEYQSVQITGSKERFIMNDLGYYRVYRCGNSIWEWRKQNR
jgi:hypothetical protein